MNAKGKWTVEEIKAKVNTELAWTERAVVALYDYQTADEKKADETKHLNEVGFNYGDAPYLSYVACWVKSGRHISGRHLPETRRRLEKYAGQLARIANKVQ